MAAAPGALAAGQAPDTARPPAAPGGRTGAGADVPELPGECVVQCCASSRLDSVSNMILPGASLANIAAHLAVLFAWNPSTASLV